MSKQESPEEKVKEIKINISDFCEEAKLSAYHTFAFKKVFNEEELKTKEEWKKFLVGKKLIKEEEF